MLLYRVFFAVIITLFQDKILKFNPHYIKSSL
ncbi:hypothetical protein HNQ55_001176 [Thalassotalea piscium]|uniref:Uncharacterized protein n=1 Tax=Thalassotalea piscium TaxID=1230533 RepID=A0A7X0NG50_9GAMM|nr:hypothetical protein [Thalassotalea piscium]